MHTLPITSTTTVIIDIDFIIILILLVLLLLRSIDRFNIYSRSVERALGGDLGFDHPLSNFHISVP